MAAIVRVTANRVEVVESILQLTLPVAELITPGDMVRIDVTTGRFTLANATVLAEARAYGMAVGHRQVTAGLVITAIRIGVVDGFNLDARAYDAQVFLGNADGGIDDVAGTISTAVGRVIPATANLLGGAFDKLLHLQVA